MARVFKFAQKEYGINCDTITFKGIDDTTFTYNGVPVMGQGSTLAVAAVTGSTPNNAGLAIALVGKQYTLTTEPADATHPGLVTAGAQNIGGAKTFASTIAASNFSGSSSGTNTGDAATPNVTLAVVGAVPNANGATLTGQVLNLQPASATQPGVVTAGTQTIAGNKTLTGTTAFSAEADFNADVYGAANVFLTSVLSSTVSNDILTLDGTSKVTKATNTMAINRTAGANALKIVGDLWLNNATAFATPTAAMLCAIEADTHNQVVPLRFACCNGIVPTTGQTCSLTPTQIAFGSMTPTNNQGFTFASNKFTFAKAGTYTFQIKVQFSAGPTEWAIKMRQGVSGGALSDTAQDGGITNSTLTGSVITIATFKLDAQGTTATDVDFTIAAQSFPAATFPTINSSGSFDYDFVGKFDYTEF